MIKLLVALSWTACFLAVLGGTEVSAQTLLYDSGGFESGSGFSLGDLHLQSSTLTPAPWYRDVPYDSMNDAGGIPATVIATPATGNVGTDGSQVVSLSRSATEYDTRWYPNIPNVNQGAQGVITVKWDMQVASAGASGGPIFGVEFNDYNDGARIGYVGVQAGRVSTLVLDDGSNTSDPGNFDVTTTPVSSDAWHHFTVAMNFALQSYTVSVDGTLVATQTFEYGSTSSPITAFSDASLVSYNPSETGGPGVAGTAYYDNYTITDVVPEPAMLGSIVVVGLLLRMRPSRQRCS